MTEITIDDFNRLDLRIAEVLEAKPVAGADKLLELLGGSGVVGVANDSIFAIKVSRDLASEHPAHRLAPLLGRGGGSPEMAQGKLTKPPLEAFQELEASLR